MKDSLKYLDKQYDDDLKAAYKEGLAYWQDQLRRYDIGEEVNKLIVEDRLPTREEIVEIIEVMKGRK